MSSLRYADIEYTENVTDGEHIPTTDHDEELVVAAENDMIGSVGIVELTSFNDIQQAENQE